MNDDAELLRRYADEDSEAAFTELVHRHIDLVYGAALRRTGDPHRAADVAQQVFVALARNARKISRHTVLPAWLHTTTRNAALNLMISEQRRQKRETIALALEPAAATHGSDPDWERLRPLLDSAVDELPGTDRAAVVLRFLERRTFGEIGAVLRLSEDAARMRTERALDKLRVALARRGITSTAAALGAIVSSQSLVSAPAGLAAMLASQSLAVVGTGVFATFMTAKLLTTAVLSAFVAFGAGAYIGFNHQPAALPLSPPGISREAQLIASLRQENQGLISKIAGLNADIARRDAARAELAGQRPASHVATPAAKSPNIGLPLYELQQSVLNNLRQIAAARDQFELENGHAAASIGELVGVGRFIKTVRTVGGEDYSSLSMLSNSPLTVITPDGVSVTFDPSGLTTTKPDIPPAILRAQELAQKVQPAVMKAIEAYRAAHNGNNPPSEGAILPYFATPQEGADYVEVIEARKTANQ